MAGIQDLPIGKKLFIGFSSLIVIFGISSTMSYRANLAADKAIYDLTDASENITTGVRILEGSNQLRLNALRFIFEDQLDSFHENARTGAEESQTALEELVERRKGVDDGGHLAKIKAALEEYSKGFADIVTFNKELDRALQDVDTTGDRVQASFEQVQSKADAKTMPAAVAWANEGELYYNDVRIAVLDSLHAGTPEAFAQLDKEIGEFESHVSGFKDDSKEQAAAIARLKEETAAYVSAARRVAQGLANIAKTRTEKLDTNGPIIVNQTDDLVVKVKQHATEVEKKAHESNAQATLMGLVTGGIGLAVGAFMAWFITVSICRPLREVIDRVSDIAQGEGDLTRRLNFSRKDELGELAKWFDMFVSKIHVVVKQVADSCHSVSAAATQIAASAEEMASGMTKQESQTAQVSAAVEEMSATVNDVAKKSEQAAQAAADSKRDADTGGKVVLDTVTEMKGISTVVSESARSVNDLGKQSEQIGQIIAVINDIADQTNLLALNAAIEAARAGEHGRGFAVVADEVRKLAERTTKATEEVATSIRQIQDGTGNAVKQIESSSQSVHKGVELANSAGDSLRRIQSGSERVGEMVSQIAAAATEQAAASEQIARSVTQIAAVTRESTEGANQAAQAATTLSKDAESMRALVAQFKV